MIEVLPAIMPDSLDDLRDKMSRVNSLVSCVQVDVMDGKFVSQATWPHVNDSGDFERIINEENGMPFWDSLDVEVDLMVAYPEEVVSQWVRAGASRIILHAESVGDVASALASIPREYVEAGIALNVDTDIKVIEKYKDMIDVVQCMGIARIGFQGEPFDSRVIPKIELIREKYPDILISVDGSVNLETARDLVSAGAQRLVVGSALFEGDSLEETLSQIQESDVD